MAFKLFRVVLLSLFFLVTTLATVAQAASEEGGGHKQSPVQVMVQIAVTAIVLRVLGTFSLP